jgi:hypothetical protein
MSLFCAVVLAGIFAVSAREKTGRTRFRVFAAGAGPLELLARRWRTAAAIGLLLRRGEPAPCHCFGVQDAPLGPAHLVRNLVLLAFAVVGTLSPAGTYDAGAVALAVASGALVAVLAVRLDDLVALFSPPRPARPLR